MAEKPKSAHLCAASSARRFSTIGFVANPTAAASLLLIFLSDTYPALLWQRNGNADLKMVFAFS